MAPLIELLPRVADKLADAELLKKTKSKKESKKTGGGIIDIINTISKDVEENLGEYKSQYQIIQSLDTFEQFIAAANKSGYIAIDTETTGLNPMVDKIVGLCLYTPNQMPTYVPINHVDYITNERYSDQLTEAEIKPILETLTAKIIMFNAQFDIRVIRHSIGVYLTCWWDTYIAAKLMDENLKSNKLKELHQRYVLRDSKDEKTFKELFDNINFSLVPIEYAYLYAAHDAIITYELQQFQYKYVNPHARPDLAEVYNLFMTIEMPCVNVVCDMEDTGVEIDVDYVKNYLSPKYNAIAAEKLKLCHNEIEKHREKLNAYLRTHPNSTIEEPLNIDSPVQLAEFLYDVLGEKPRDKKKPRGTGEEILVKMNIPLAEAILDYRGATKLIGTYIDKMPDVILDDGRVHCKFNQYGAKTGRFSSSDPNLQNIPAKNTEIRKMFVGGTDTREVESNNNVFIFNKHEEVELTDDSWIFVELLQPGDLIKGDDGVYVVIKTKSEPSLTGKVYIMARLDS